MAKAVKTKTNYSLRRRFFNQLGEPLDWQDYGHGEWKGLDTVQDQIKGLANRGRKVEIEFVHNGKLCGFDGSETGKTMIFEKR